MIDSRTLSVAQILGCRQCGNFDPFVPIGKEEQLWFVLVDSKSKKIANKKAMTLAQADLKNVRISDTGFAWVRA